MIDWVWRFLGYTLKKDERKEYVDRKIKEEEDRKAFEELAKITPSFSRCAIPNERSQKQKKQAKSYAAAVARLPPLVSHVDEAFPGAIMPLPPKLPQSPLVPTRKSKRNKNKK
tara:strand:+ start:489 stop:827 length:339 start_codon:yes stop_codon:yes gene_type:complete